MLCVAHRGKALRVRIPFIPEFNDNTSTIQDILDVLVPNLHHIDLIPCHNLGIGKYKGLGRTYRFLNIKTPVRDDVEMGKTIIES